MHNQSPLNRLSITALIMVLLLSACGSYEIQVPPELDDGWATGTLDEVGLDERPIGDALTKIARGTYPEVHSLLIVKDGRLVVEEYFPGHAWQYDAENFHGPYTEFDRETLHTIMSVTKAVTSAAAGLAIDQGAVGSEQDRVFDYFPDYQDLRSEDKEALRIEHLLTMSSGLQWNEWELPLSDPNNDLIQLWIVDDPIGYILAKALVHKPGASWYYSGGDVNLLGEIIQEATGQRLDHFVAETLFDPLGIDAYQWDYLNEDLVYASGNLMMRPRDMAKLGYLLLNEGRWQDQQILTAGWAAKTTAAAIESPNTGEGESYGYQWWQKRFEGPNGPLTALHRSGWGGQALYLFPELDLLVAMTGGTYEGQPPAHTIVQEHILPAVQTSAAP